MYKSIKEVHCDLVAWGKFWAAKESLQGFSSKSNLLVLKEVLDSGVAGSGTTHLVSHLSCNIHVPHYIQVVDDAIDTLGIEHKKALTQQYIKNNKASYHWIEKAKGRLLALL